MNNVENINDENISIDLKTISFSKIEDISQEDYVGSVYDLEVDNEPNYLVDGVIVHNGGGKRKGSFAIYLSPSHPDIFDFLDLRKNNGKEELRARDLNLALWAPDLFFKRVESDEDWHLFDPNVARGMEDVYDETPEGGSYTNLYNKYVAEGKFAKVVKARDLWAAILTSQIETGQPYILAKDACNRKSNQKNLGTIKSSNLCLSGDTEVLVRNSTSTDANTYLAKLEDVVESVRSGEQLYIQSYNETSGEQTFSKVSEAAMTNPYAEVYKITYHGKEIVCTGDHKVYTKRGWVEAQNLLEEDELLEYLP